MTPAIFTSEIQWIINKHESTNHFYDEYLPYKFHLQMVVQVFHDFKHLLPKNLYVEEGTGKDITLSVIGLSCWAHDLIEDTRTSYNEIRQFFGAHIADIVFAVTNNTGRNRAERANAAYYQKINKCPGAVFVKLCDRIANMQYSKLTKSRQREMYLRENNQFISSLNIKGYEDLVQFLRTLC